MRRALMLGFVLVGCGSDKDADEPEGCAALALEVCEDDPSCLLLEMRPWDDAAKCWQEDAPAACVPARATCATVVGCIADGAGQRWFNDGECLPEGWNEGGGAECAGEPICD
jgi:hypothetical protein